MLWLFVLLIALIATLPLSDNSPSRDINFYKNGMVIYHKNSHEKDKYED